LRAFLIRKGQVPAVGQVPLIVPVAFADDLWEAIGSDPDAFARVVRWDPLWLRSFLKWSGSEQLAVDGIDVAGGFEARWKQQPGKWLEEILPLIDVKKEDRGGKGVF
jgi:hypothetical protein